MQLRLSAFVERLRSSLFFVPMLYVLGGIVLAEASLTVDQELTSGGVGDLPFRLTSTVESARSILSTVASATMTFAGIAFSVALLIFQLASSQYSPRVVHGLFRDPLNKQVMGLVVGTFTYCLLVLRTVRSAIESDGEPVIPHLSVAVAVVLGIVVVLAIVAFINHAAHRMDVSQILEDVVTETLDGLGDRPVAQYNSALLAEVPTAEGFSVRFDRNGWIQQVDSGALMGVLGIDGVMRFDTAVGRYAIAGTTLCTVWPMPDADDHDDVVARARAAVQLGDTRTMQQDSSYGLRQIVDVALRALSPGVNDPTTAQDSIFHGAAVLHALLRAPLDEVLIGDGGRRLVLPEADRPTDLVGLAFDEVRLAAAGQPTVCVYLLEAMSLLIEALAEDGLAALAVPVQEQARLVVVAAEAAGLPEPDLDRVRDAYAKRFDSRPSPAGTA